MLCLEKENKEQMEMSYFQSNKSCMYCDFYMNKADWTLMKIKRVRNITWYGPN